MSFKNVKIYYLYHSGYAMEIDSDFFIFDYWSKYKQNNKDNILNRIQNKDVFKDKSNIYVFVSHNHRDHFDPVILDWADINPNIRYILSDDIVIDKSVGNFYYISPYETIDVDNINIKAYGSTDEGVSFLVKAYGLSIFHAGDLNWWYWFYESTEDEMKEYEHLYKNEIEKISGENIDIAFFPVDPRLKEYYYKGGEYFIENLKPKLFMPMHFGDKYEITKLFKDKVNCFPVEVVEILYKGQEIKYEKS